MTHSVFICHCLDDTQTVCRLQESLSARGFEVRVDKRVIRSGDPLGPEIRAAIEAADVFLLVVSKNANSSEWVQRETQYALKIKTQRNTQYCIIPVLLDDSQLGALRWIIPEDTRSIQCNSTEDGLQEALPELMVALEEALFPAGSTGWML